MTFMAAMYHLAHDSGICAGPARALWMNDLHAHPAPHENGSAKPFLLELIKPSHYDDEGYVIQWWRAFVPSNSLSSVRALEPTPSILRYLPRSLLSAKTHQDRSMILRRPVELSIEEAIGVRSKAA